MHSPDVLIDVRGLLAAEIAVRALVPGRFPALVPEVAEHGVPSAVAVVTIRTVELAGVRVVLLYVTSLRVPLQARGEKLEKPSTYKKSCHGQHRRSSDSVSPAFGATNASGFHAEGMFARKNQVRSKEKKKRKRDRMDEKGTRRVRTRTDSQAT